jgi:hypothetical protein
MEIPVTIADTVLANETGIIASTAQDGRIAVVEIAFLQRTRMKIRSMRSFVKASKNARPAGRADRTRYECVREISAIRSKLIQIGCLDYVIPCAPDGIPSLIVRQEHEYVRATNSVSRFRGRTRDRYGTYEQDQDLFHCISP